ncbi:MAG: phosphonopyruvate decarboxylase [Cytophagaceae bacterium]|nr:phosphonopyruvate decarboxylase [Cytophagaceae bacterium]
MISVKSFFDSLIENNVSFFTGVPDSLLKDICAYISDNTDNKNHIISNNEGGAVAIGAGYYLATGKIPLIYLQNSGLGNTINPLLSLADKEVYSIPMVLLIGWRGEPGIKDEPQHIKQGKVQNKLLEVLEIPYEIIDSNTLNFKQIIKRNVEIAMKLKAPVAIVVRKNSFENYSIRDKSHETQILSREEALSKILKLIPKESLILSTTGMLSRELFEYRVRNGEPLTDFLTVGSMGHCSQISLAVSLFSKKMVFCFDGDGAAIMHLGSFPIIGQNANSNFVHILFNNGSHDSVGGQPTVGLNIDFCKIALASGYKNAISLHSFENIAAFFKNINNIDGPSFIEVVVKKGSRPNLGRPTGSPFENKEKFIIKLRSGESTDF